MTHFGPSGRRAMLTLLFIFLEYVTPAENFQIGDRKKINVMGTLYRNSPVV